MRLSFQERPWDLYLSLGYSGILGILILAGNLGLIAAILLIMFVPGYLLVAALFPRNEPIGWLERIALSFGLSVALIPLFALLLNFTPYGIFRRPIVISILIFTTGMGLTAYLRRVREPVEGRLSATLNLGSRAWREFSGLERGLAVGLAASIVFAGSVFVYVVTTPGVEPFTEFYLLGAGTVARGYPTSLNITEPGTVIIGIVNHELEQVDYTVRVDRLTAMVVWNETGGYNETVEGGAPKSMAWFNITLKHDSNWTMPFTFSIEVPGLWMVRLLLFKDGDLATVYRNLHFFVTVRDA